MVDCTYYIDEACNNGAVRGMRCVGDRCKQRVPYTIESTAKHEVIEDVEVKSFLTWLKKLFGGQQENYAKKCN